MSEPGVTITLSQIYGQQQDMGKKLDRLASVVEALAKVDTRIDAVEAQILTHDDRLDGLEQHKAVLDSRVRAPWWIVLGAVVTVITGLAGVIGLVAALGQVADALNGG